MALIALTLWALGFNSPQAISSGMLRRPPTNLNRQSEDATILLIREVLAKGIVLSEVSILSGLVISLTKASEGLCRCVGYNHDV